MMESSSRRQGSAKNHRLDSDSTVKPSKYALLSPGILCLFHCFSADLGRSESTNEMGNDYVTSVPSLLKNSTVTFKIINLGVLEKPRLQLLDL